MVTEKVQSQYQIKTTTNYSLFRDISGNRVKNLQHLNRLEQSIKERYLFTVITVNEKMEIIDGQHRFEVLSKLGLPIHYVICKGYGLPEVHRMNTNTKNWTADDYMNAYVDLGYKDYITYKRFKENYGLSHSETRVLLGKANKATFNSGSFKVRHYEQGVSDIERIYELKPYYEGVNRRSFILAMHSLLRRSNFEFDDFLHRVKMQPNKLVDCPTQASYVALIEDIYNYRRREKVNLRY